MKWSWRLGRILGIDVYIHATFVILLGWIGLGEYLRSRSFAAAAAGVGFMLAVFGSVVLHELGHALTARRFGVRTRDITLLPIGGVARLERMPEEPWQELLIALAGPLVNVLIAMAIFALLVLGAGPTLVQDLDPAGPSPFLAKLLRVNLTLAIFNLIPAFPMDGGRALRALLALRTDYVRATQMAARLGQGIALVLGILGLFTNPVLVFVALFVWIGAAAEAAGVQARAALEGVPVRAAMIRDFRTLSPGDTLGDAVEQLLAGSQIDFPVVDGAGELVGVLTRNLLLRHLADRGPGTFVGEAMERRFLVADPRDMLGQALERLQTCDCHSLPVVRDGRLVGIVTMENIGELLMIEEALGPGPHGPLQTSMHGPA
jgi:Zn-dependent protease